MQVKGYITLKIMVDSWVNAITIKVKYLVVYTTSPYKVILGKPTLNLLGEILSTLHLSLKYSLLYGCIGTVKEDHTITQESYHSNLEMTREPAVLGIIPCLEIDDTNTARWDRRLWAESERLNLTKYLKEVHIGHLHQQVRHFFVRV